MNYKPGDQIRVSQNQGKLGYTGPATVIEDCGDCLRVQVESIDDILVIWPNEVIVEEEGVILQSSGYEWDCPRCGASNHIAGRASEVTCEGCEATFMVSDITHSG